MIFGINGGEFLVLGVIALLVVGPERLPAYAEQLGRWVRTLRAFLSTAKERVADELGEEAADVDWATLDPRRYDPRRIVREALLEDPAPSVAGAVGAGSAAAAASAATTSSGGRRYTTGRARAGAAAATSGSSGAPGPTASSGASRTRAGGAPFDPDAT